MKLSVHARLLARLLFIPLPVIPFLTACDGDPVDPGPGARLLLTLPVSPVSAGDVVAVEARLVDGAGTALPTPTVSLMTDNPTVAVIDGSSRLRAVAEGTTRLVGTAAGAEGEIDVAVLAGPAAFALDSVDGLPLPLLDAADSVVWEGQVEYHEIFIEGGQLRLSGGALPTYDVRIEYREYDVRTIGGQRVRTLRIAYDLVDFGVVGFDARGDLGMTSTLVSPLAHTAVPTAQGMRVRFRIPGTDDRMDLSYRR